MWLSLSMKRVSRLFLLDFRKEKEKWKARVFIDLCVCMPIISCVKDVEKDTSIV